jgi:REP element-mobilizing transposase RayT
MSRPLRIEFEGAVYHVTSRGNARQPIFLDGKDRERFLSIFASVVDRFKWLCHGYCLMDNHYHVLIETPKPNLAEGMRQLNGVYTQRFNWHHKRVGHLLQGRYKAILVQKDDHLLALCRYIVLNPVRAGAVARASQWKWSNYQATAGIAKVPRFLTVEWVLSQFGQDRQAAKKSYRAFVAAGVKQSSPWADLKGHIFLGTEEFVSRVRELVSEKERMKEIPCAQRYATRPSLGRLLPRNLLAAGPPRDKAVWKSHVLHGYRLCEIADHIGVHYSTISRCVKRVEQQEILHCKT